MSGAITRLPGEKFADFAKRQRALQLREEAEHTAMVRAAKALRKNPRRFPDAGDWDFDYSMNA